MYYFEKAEYEDGCQYNKSQGEFEERERKMVSKMPCILFL